MRSPRTRLCFRVDIHEVEQRHDVLPARASPSEINGRPWYKNDRGNRLYFYNANSGGAPSCPVAGLAQGHLTYLTRYTRSSPYLHCPVISHLAPPDLLVGPVAALPRSSAPSYGCRSWTNTVGGASTSTVLSSRASACMRPGGENALPVPRKSMRATNPDEGPMT